MSAKRSREDGDDDTHVQSPDAKRQKTDDDDFFDREQDSSDDAGSVASFDDGYDSDLMGDDEDREWLDSLPELEREAELNRRYEKRKAGQQNVALQRRLRESSQAQEQRRKKLKKRGSQARSKPGRKSTDAEETFDRESSSEEEEEVRGKTRRRLRGRARRDSRGSDSEESLPDGYTHDRPPSDSEDGADSDYSDHVSQREKQKARLKAMRRRRRGGESSGDEDDDEAFYAGGRRGGRGRRGGHFTAHAWSPGGSMSDDSSDAADVVKEYDPDELERRQKRREEKMEPLTLEAVNATLATRRFMACHIDEPFLRKAVPGLLVRVFLGKSPESRKPVYKLVTVQDIVRHNEYVVPLKHEKVKTWRHLLLAAPGGTDKKAFRVTQLSDTKVTQEEFSTFLREHREAGVSPPTPASLRRRVRKVQKLKKSYVYTGADLEKKLETRRSHYNAKDDPNLGLSRLEFEARRSALEEELSQALRDIDREWEDARAKAVEEGGGEEADIDARYEKKRAERKRSKEMRMLKYKNWLDQIDTETSRRRQREVQASGRVNIPRINARNREKNRRALEAAKKHEAMRKEEGKNDRESHLVRRRVQAEKLWKSKNEGDVALLESGGAKPPPASSQEEAATSSAPAGTAERKTAPAVRKPKKPVSEADATKVLETVSRPEQDPSPRPAAPRPSPSAASGGRKRVSLQEYLAQKRASAPQRA